MRARLNYYIDAVILAIYVLVTNPVATGTPVHEWLSLSVAIAAFVHLVLHWEWATGAVKRFCGKLNSMSRVNLVVDGALLVAGVATAMSGLLVSRSALGVFGYVVSETSVWHRAHSEASTVLLALVGLHFGLHWDWIASMTRQVLKRVRKAGDSGAAPVAERSGARASAPKRAFRAAFARTASALVLVGAVAGSVWMAAPRAEAGLSWLVLPGASQVIERAEAASVSTTVGTAANFEGTATERVMVRTSHSLLLLVIAILAGSATPELLRRR